MCQRAYNTYSPFLFLCGDPQFVDFFLIFYSILLEIFNVNFIFNEVFLGQFIFQQVGLEKHLLVS